MNPRGNEVHSHSFTIRIDRKKLPTPNTRSQSICKASYNWTKHGPSASWEVCKTVAVKLNGMYYPASGCGQVYLVSNAAGLKVLRTYQLKQSRKNSRRLSERMLKHQRRQVELRCPVPRYRSHLPSFFGHRRRTMNEKQISWSKTTQRNGIIVLKWTSDPDTWNALFHRVGYYH